MGRLALGSALGKERLNYESPSTPSFSTKRLISPVGQRTLQSPLWALATCIPFFSVQNVFMLTPFGHAPLEISCAIFSPSSQAPPVPLFALAANGSFSFRSFPTLPCTRPGFTPAFVHKFFDCEVSREGGAFPSRWFLFRDSAGGFSTSRQTPSPVWSDFHRGPPSRFDYTSLLFFAPHCLALTLSAGLPSSPAPGFFYGFACPFTVAWFVGSSRSSRCVM